MFQTENALEQKRRGTMRVFLSHSSKDKHSYVDYIKEHLCTDEVFIDESSFKTGEKSTDEMIRLINDCQIFVIFISNSSLSSQYVQFEIKSVEKVKDDLQKRIIPIVIDFDIRYDDDRLPDWLRDYNLRPLRKPKHALSRIIEEIKILTWKNYDIIKKLDQIFRGRNEFVNKFETHYSDRRRGKAIAYTASGFEKIGRRSFLSFCLKKVGKIRNSYEFMSFKLTKNDSIEDFIFRMNELGVSPEINVEYLIDKSMSEKINMAIEILSTYTYDDVVLIYDSGCIIQRDGSIADWFLSIINGVDSSVVGCRLAIASQYTYLRETISGFWNISLPELSPNERRWLLEDYIDIYKIGLTDEEFETCQNWLKGYPEQIFFLAKNLAERGFLKTKEISDKIVNYSLRKAEVVLQDYLEDSKKMMVV